MVVSSWVHIAESPAEREPIALRRSSWFLSAASSARPFYLVRQHTQLESISSLSTGMLSRRIFTAGSLSEGTLARCCNFEH